MGWLIEGLNGACDPKRDFNQSVEYCKLSPAMEKAYGTLKQFDLNAIEDSGIIPRTSLIATDEEIAIVDKIISGYKAAGEKTYIWRKGLIALASTDDPEGLIASLLKEEEEDDRLIEEEAKRQEEIWNTFTEQQKEVFIEIYEWEQKNWANAFTYEDSPYLTMPQNIKDDYDKAYPYLSTHYNDPC